MADTGNDRIQKIQPDGNITYIGLINLSERIGSSNFGTGEFNQPYGVALDSKDNLYVADSFNQRIQQFILSQHWQFKILPQHWQFKIGK